MALTRSALREKGVTEKEILDFIMEEHGNTIEAAKEKAKETAEKAAEKMQATIDALQEKIDNTPEPPASDSVDYKAKYEAELSAHGDTKKTMQKTYDDYVAGVESEKTTSQKREAIRKQLAADGANQKLIGLLEKEFDLAAVELDGESIKGWDALSKPVKETYADVFGTTQIRGTEVPNPPAGGGGDKNPWLKENHSLKEQTRLYRENPALAIEMAKAAGVNLQ